MVIDKKTVNNMINESNDSLYLQKLYDIYNLINRLVEGDFDNNKELLMQLEDEIYTISDEVLSEQKRILLELSKIAHANSENKDVVQKGIIDKKIKSIMELIEDVFNNDVESNYIYETFMDRIKKLQEEAIFNIKKKIVMLEAELDIPISFFEPASVVFMDMYKKYSKSVKKDKW